MTRALAALYTVPLERRVNIGFAILALAVYVIAGVITLFLPTPKAEFSQPYLT